MTDKSFVADRIVFDLDGTLVDSAPDLCAAMNCVLKDMGLSELGLDSVRAMVGHGARALIERGLSAHGVSLQSCDMPALLESFLVHYSTNIATHTRPFPGAYKVLTALSESGYRLGLCTNKPQSLTDKLMRTLKLDTHFRAMVGGDVLPVRKPDPLHLDHVLNALGGNGPALMIGDSRTDLDAARATGIPVILVDFGYSTIPVHELGADAIVGSLDELITIIRPD